MVRISFFFSFKQKTAYEMRISDWSSDVCSSDLRGSPSARRGSASPAAAPRRRQHGRSGAGPPRPSCAASHRGEPPIGVRGEVHRQGLGHRLDFHHLKRRAAAARSEEHTSELQSLMRISYAVFCLKKKNKIINIRKPVEQLTAH